MTNTPDEMLPCPFCGAATTLPPNTPYIRHPPNGCYFANHNIRFQNWQKRDSSQAPSDDAKARNLTRMQDGRIMTDEEIARAAIPPKPAIPSAGGVEESFQTRVGKWMEACFTPAIIADKLERADRFIEESLELVQATGYSAERAHALAEYVFNRPVGEPFQEVGGVMVTLAALCNPHDLNMEGAAETELARVWTTIDKIRAKQATKPVGCALPVPSVLKASGEE